MKLPSEFSGSVGTTVIPLDAIVELRAKFDKNKVTKNNLIIFIKSPLS
jgi:hypothetical protein